MSEHGRAIFNEPTSLDDASDRIRDLQARVETMQRQLGDRNRTIPTTGARMDGIRYFDWRKRTQAALGFALDELRQLKRWRREHHDEFSNLPTARELRTMLDAILAADASGDSLATSAAISAARVRLDA